ncbi:MAG TPA: peptidase U32 family protein [Bacillota bacterium]|nr:peptidase U32 family protein [Bacillota bacterium]
MNKPELLVTVGDLSQVERMIHAGADALTLGEERFGMRLPGYFTIEEMKEAVHLAHTKGVKVYAAVTSLLHNDMLDGLEEYLLNLAEIGVDAIEFADPAVYMTAKEVIPQVAMHWNAEIIATSAKTVNYWASKGIKRAVIARELNMDEITGIKEQVDIEIGVQVHGITCIFHSKRELVGSYFEHIGKDRNSERKDQERKLLMREEKREENYPVFEDKNGTHIMSNEDICILENLDELMDANINSFRIDGLLKSAEYNETVVKAYRKAVDLYMDNPSEFYNEVDSLHSKIEEKQDAKRPLTTGFYFKELVF